MTVEELKNQLHNTFFIDTPPPKKLEVDADTYGHVTQAILDWHKSKFGRVHVGSLDSEVYVIELHTGPNNGLLFKGIELILKDKE